MGVADGVQPALRQLGLLRDPLESAEEGLRVEHQPEFVGRVVPEVSLEDRILAAERGLHEAATPARRRCRLDSSSGSRCSIRRST